MAEVNEVVRVSVIFDNGQQAVQQVQLTEDSVTQLADAFRVVGQEGRNAGTNIVEGVDLVAARLQSQLNDPLQRSVLTIRQVRQAQNELNDAFERAATATQGRQIAELRRQYDGLEQEIVEAAEAQDVFRTRLNGFGAQGSAGAASLIQLTRGVEDLRFGAFAAINNIEPFITSLQRLDRVAASTGVSVRQQLIGALSGPAGLLFIGQALFTAFTLLRPVIDSLFEDGTEDATEFRDLVEEIGGQLLQFEEFDISFNISADPEELQDQVNAVEREIQRLNNLAAADVNQPDFDFLVELDENLRGLLPAQQALNDAQQELNDGLIEQAEFERRVGDILKDNAEELLNAGVTRQQLAREDIELLGPQLEALRERLVLARSLVSTQEALNRAGLEETSADAEENAREAEREATRIARLRERLERELAATRASLLDDAAEQEIAKTEETFRRRIDLARQLNDNEAILELEIALQQRITQIRAEALAEQLDEERKAAEARARDAERLENELQKSRIASIEDELEQRLAQEEEQFRKRIELATDQNNLVAALELHLLLEQRKTQITEEFAQKRADAELREQQRLNREAERAAARAQREFEARVREVQRFTDAFINSVVDAAQTGRGISDSEIELVRDQFDAEEAALRESYDRRLLTAQEFSLQLRQLNQQRADFDKEVEEENAQLYKTGGHGFG